MGFFHVKVIINNSVTHREVQLSFPYGDFASFGHIPAVELWNHMVGGAIFNFLRNLYTVFHS